MRTRISIILSRFAGCYSITRSLRQSIRFALMSGRNGKTRIKLDGHEVWLRKNISDQEVFLATFLYGYHRCPVDLGPSPFIVDLGSNIGLTILDFKLQYPAAVIAGAELDMDNYELCLKNIEQLKNCSVMNTAIWKEDGWVHYDGKDTQSFAVSRESIHGREPVKSRSMESFLNELGIDPIDYLKMDIEGGEYAVFLESSELSWLQKIKYLSIEVHDTPGIDKVSGAEKLKKELEKHNFLVFKYSQHWSSLFAVHKSQIPA